MLKRNEHHLAVNYQDLITIFITSETRKIQYDNLKGPIVIK